MISAMKSKEIELDTQLSKEALERLSQFRFQLRSFLRVSEDICRDAQVTPLQYLLLLHVRGIPGKDWANIGELAERLQAKHHSVVALVNRCEEADLVERRPAETDKRQVAVHVTAECDEILLRRAARHQRKRLR